MRTNATIDRYFFMQVKLYRKERKEAGSFAKKKKIRVLYHKECKETQRGTMFRKDFALCTSAFFSVHLCETLINTKY